MQDPKTPAADRKPYAKPELQEFGSIAQITAVTAGGAIKDGAMTPGNDKS